MGNAESGDDDNSELIDSFIAGVSKEIETHLDRQILIAGAKTEIFDVTRTQFRFSLVAYPVTSVTTVHNATDRVFDAASLIAATDYTTDLDNGILTVDKVGLLAGPGVCQIVYAGGMATGTEDFISKFPDISMACAEEVTFRFQNKDKPGIIAIAAGGSTATILQRQKFLASVEQALDPYMRVF